MTERKVIICMPVLNDFEYFKIAVDCIVNSTKYPYTFLIIESESTDGSKEYSDLLPKIYPLSNIKWEIIHTKKEGPLKAYNLAFKIARERQADLYLTQTDVIHFQLFRRDWLAELVYLAQDESIGLIGPYGAFGRAGPNYWDGVWWLGGWACYVPIRTINLLGGYDEAYEIGDGVDIDYSYNATRHNLKIAQANYFVQHHWLTAHLNDQREDINAIRARNGEYFRKKFNLGDHHVD